MAEQKHRISKQHHKKLPRLPKNAQISRRPLLRPAIPSPYSGAQQQKIVYVSAKTPFLSAVKRVEKLLQLADKRLVQSATTLAKYGKGKRRRGKEEDGILDVAETVERRKKGDGAGEEVVLRGTGKAIQKCLELGLWFQQREEYNVRLVTGSVGAIDDVEVDEEEEYTAGAKVAEKKGENTRVLQMEEDTEAGAEYDADGGDEAMDIEPRQTSEEKASSKGHSTSKSKATQSKDSGGKGREIPETRIRYTSSLEVYVCLR